MTERDALLAAICAEPAEDTPRLAFADWLDENNEHQQAEFIRAQIENPSTEHWTLRNANRFTRGGAIVERILELPIWNLIPQEQFADSVEVKNSSSFGAVWRRGFVDEVTCSLAMWFSSHSRWRSVYPIRKVRIAPGNLSYSTSRVDPASSNSPIIVRFARHSKPYEGLECRLTAYQYRVASRRAHELLPTALRQTYPDLQFSIPL